MGISKKRFRFIETLIFYLKYLIASYNMKHEIAVYLVRALFEAINIKFQNLLIGTATNFRDRCSRRTSNVN